MTPKPEQDGPKGRFEKADYQRLKKMEIDGLEDYRKMREAEKLTPDAVVSFINQLSPWNLKTTGVSVLEAYTAAQVAAARHETAEAIHKYYRSIAEVAGEPQDTIKLETLRKTAQMELDRLARLTDTEGEK